MRVMVLCLLALALSGCDREPLSSSVDNDAANSSATSSPPAIKSDTLKVTYSKADPFEQSKPAPKDAMDAHAHDHSDHGGQEKSDAQKPVQKEHEHK